MKKDKDITFADRIKGFDFYKDLPQELSEPSVSGATGKIITYLQLLIPLNSFFGCDWIYDIDVHLIDSRVYAIQKDK